MRVGELKREMDIGFTRVRSELQDGLEQVRSELQDGLGQVRSELQDAIGQVRSELRDGLEQGRSELHEAIEQLRTDLREEIATEGVTTRRHLDIVAEGIRTDVSTLATAVQALTRTVDDMRQERGTILALLDNHEVRIQALEHHPE